MAIKLLTELKNGLLSSKACVKHLSSQASHAERVPHPVLIPESQQPKTEMSFPFCSVHGCLLSGDLKTEFSPCLTRVHSPPLGNERSCRWELAPEGMMVEIGVSMVCKRGRVEERRAEALRNFGKEQCQPSLIRKGVVGEVA